MRKAARCIIRKDDKILVMRRIKQSSEYFTLVGGRVNDDEAIEQALVREVKEETGLTVTRARLVFIEEHPHPYNEQYAFLCEVAPHATIALEADSEEANLNKHQINIHNPEWVSTGSFASLPFRTPLLQSAIIKGLSKGFPTEPIVLREERARPTMLRRVMRKLTRS